MASDLSTLIQEGICTTINGLIAKNAELKETTKAVKEDMESINLLKVESSFEFDNITSNWSFFVPAYTASYIFNMMLGDDSEPQLEIDEDIADAMREFISNLSGGLTTAINAENFEDLGQSKFVIGESENISSESLEDDLFENMYKFSIDLEGKNLFLFIKYDEIILPFLSLISSSEESKTEQTEEPQKEELENAEEEQGSTPPEENTQEKQTLENQPQENETPQDLSKGTQTKEIPQTQQEGENIEDEDKGTGDKKLKIIIISVAALLLITLIAAVIMYFSGVFDEPEAEKEVPVKKEVQDKNNIKVVKYEEKADIDFKITDINKKRVNARLAALTKYEILDEEEIQAQEAAEKERLYQLQKEQELIEFAAKNKEEDIFTKKDKDPKREIDIKTKFAKADLPGEKKSQETAQDIPQKSTPAQETVSAKDGMKKETPKEVVKKTENNKLKFVLVESLKYRLYNELISQITTQNARISICKNEQGRTTVYIGPFNSSNEQGMMMELIKKENISGARPADITAKEFDTRCSFE